MPDTLAIYDGYVSVDDADVHVILGIDDERVTMSSNGSEIGEWSASDVAVAHVGDGVYSITAENESLRFVPNDPTLFALDFDGHDPNSEVTEDEPAGTAIFEDVEPDAVEEAPPPGQSMVALVYLVASIVGALGLWALFSTLT